MPLCLNAAFLFSELDPHLMQSRTLKRILDVLDVKDGFVSTCLYKKRMKEKIRGTIYNATDFFSLINEHIKADDRCNDYKCKATAIDQSYAK